MVDECVRVCVCVCVFVHVCACVLLVFGFCRFRYQYQRQSLPSNPQVVACWESGGFSVMVCIAALVMHVF